MGGVGGSDKLSYVIQKGGGSDENQQTHENKRLVYNFLLVVESLPPSTPQINGDSDVCLESYT